MGGDLNLKKSWHPSLMSNQKKVWEEEQRALEERKKIDQIMKERAEERQIQELQEMQEAAGGARRQARVEWMYSGPSSGQTGTNEENEAYLLGRRRVDTILQGNEKEQLQKTSGQDSFMALQNANSARDTAAKIRDDPMLAIKRQEQAAYEAMMNDPVKRRMLLKAAGQDDRSPSEREHKRRKHHHSRDERERHHRHRSSRYEDEDRTDRSRHRRRRSSSRSKSRSPTPPRRREHSSSAHRRRSHSPDRNYRKRSRSPRRVRDKGNEARKSKSWGASRLDSRTSPRRSPSVDRQAEAAARLAAMQQDASELDQQRQRRLDELADRERAQAEQDSAARARNAKYGGRADFVNGFHKRAGDFSLGDRLGRNGRGTMQASDG